MNRRTFIKGIGAFMILPGAGRIWKAKREIAWPVRCFDSPYLAARAQWAESQGGIYQVLQECSKVVEPQPPLDLQKLFDEVYRIRQARGPEPEFIEISFTEEIMPYQHHLHDMIARIRQEEMAKMGWSEPQDPKDFRTRLEGTWN